MSASRLDRTKVFISYSHKDTEWLERLQVHLKPLEREGKIERWDDTLIGAGEKWKEAIRHAITSAKVAVLLVSADFLSSDFIATDELPSLLAAAKAEGTVILPVILSPSWFEQMPNLAQFQSVNPPSQPLIGLSKAKQEAALVQVANRIKQALYPQVSAPSAQSTVSSPSAEYASMLSPAYSPLPNQSVLSWLWKNKEWAFFGIGVTLLVLFIGGLLLFSKPNVNVKVHNGIGAGGNIEGRDFNINPWPGSIPNDTKSSRD
jgi:hypothetical protein